MTQITCMNRKDIAAQDRNRIDALWKQICGPLREMATLLAQDQSSALPGHGFVIKLTAKWPGQEERSARTRFNGLEIIIDLQTGEYACYAHDDWLH